MFKVLIVENNPTILKLLSHFFQSEGCELRSFTFNIKRRVAGEWIKQENYLVRKFAKARIPPFRPGKNLSRQLQRFIVRNAAIHTLKAELIFPR